jgi:hypothetical protein
MLRSDPLAKAIQVEVEGRLARAEQMRLVQHARWARSGNLTVAPGRPPRTGWLRWLSNRFGAATAPVAYLERSRGLPCRASTLQMLWPSPPASSPSPSPPGATTAWRARFGEHQAPLRTFASHAVPPNRRHLP